MSAPSQWAIDYPVIEIHLEIQASTRRNRIIPLLFCFCDGSSGVLMYFAESTSNSGDSKIIFEQLDSTV